MPPPFDATTFVEFDAVTLAQQFGVAKHRHEKVIYYRKPQTYPAIKGTRPRKALEAGWICVGDSNQTARDTQLQKGHVPLPGYGYLNFDNPEQKRLLDEYGNLGPLLFHRGDRRTGLPAGAHLFPIEQIKANRWYDAELYPELRGMFPQLGGVEIEEYPCPDCGRPPFHDALDLGRHLRNAHEYDRTDLINLGNQLGISFAKIYEGKGGRKIIRFDATTTPGDADGATPGDADGEPAALPPTVKRVPIQGRQAAGKVSA